MELISIRRLGLYDYFDRYLDYIIIGSDTRSTLFKGFRRHRTPGYIDNLKHYKTREGNIITESSISQMAVRFNIVFFSSLFPIVTYRSN